MRNRYFIAFNRYLIQKNTTKYSKSQQTTEAEAGHFLYFDCKDLSYRFAFLLCLLSGQRSFSLDNKSIEDSKVRHTITEKLKHTKAGTHKKPLEFLAYPIDQKLCIVNHLKVYLDKTKSLRNDEKQLLISCINPHKAVSRDTISQWINIYILFICMYFRLKLGKNVTIALYSVVC